MQYCVAPPDPTGQAVVNYTKPIHAGSAYMIFGNATLGKNADATARACTRHCGEDGKVKGGHILTKLCVVGPTPIPCW